MTKQGALFFFFFLLWNLVVTSGFAAKKKIGTKQATASSNKGFGVPPPTLDEVLSRFRTRIPDQDPESHECPCRTSGRTYGECCGPLHQGKPCQTMTDVLKSRYSAFSWRIIKHIIDTTHVTCKEFREDRVAWAKELNSAGMFDKYDFISLEAGPEQPGSNPEEGFIQFNVILRAKEDTSSLTAGQDMVVTEKSRFVRDADGRWSYASGDVRTDARA